MSQLPSSPPAPDARERWRVVARILDGALDLALEERLPFLDEMCAGDPDLRAEVETMLAGASAEGFLESPATFVAGSMLELEDERMEERIGPYRPVRELGRGGMGVVYLAERADGQFEQRVALKLVKRGMDSDEILSRFLAERQVLARLSHPNIARLLDDGVTPEGQPWFAMEYVDGVPLHRHCDERALGVEERLAVFVSVCEAVQYAHRNLVVHRDLKPSNILVTAAGEIRLLDFGIAKALTQEPDEDTVTGAEGRMMTPEYAAPEQLRGQPVTTATDVYALGAILYLLLTGRAAHQLAGRTPSERDRIICELEPDPPSLAVRGTPQAQLRRRLSGDLDNIVMKALRKEPARRYPSVDALLEDLDRHRTGLPVRAAPDSVAYRTRKFLGRHRVGAAIAAVVFLSLAAGLGGTLWQARATAREAAKARAVKEFVIGLFRISKPEESRGREITARELLSRGAERVDSGLARQPELQAELLDALGVIHRDLGLYAEAESLLGRSVRLSRATHGPAHPDVAVRSADWAAVFAARGDYARAESLLTEAYGILRRSRGPEDSSTTAALGALAAVHRQQGDFAVAESLYREVLRIDRTRRGGDRLRLAADLDELGVTLEEAGALPRADSSYQEAFALRRAVLDEDHPQVITSLHHLAMLREKQGEFTEAERLHRDVLARRHRVYPEGHPEIAYALQSLANLLQVQGGYAEAESLNVAALSILRTRLGPEHPETVELVRNLATLKYEAGDLQGAERDFRYVLAMWTRALGKDHPTTLGALNDVAATLKYQRRFDEAEPLYRDALALRIERLGKAHPDLGESWGNLAELLYDAGRFAEAERAYRETLAVYRAALPPGHVYISGSLIGLGGTLTELGRPAEAEPMLREAVALRIDKFGADDRRTAKGQRMLGLCLAALGQRAEADQVLLDSYRTLSEAKNWYHRTLGNAVLQDLARLYRSWGEPAKAEKVEALLRSRS